MSDYVCLKATSGQKKIFVRPSQVEFVAMTTCEGTSSPTMVIHMRSGNRITVGSPATVNAAIRLLCLPTKPITRKE